MARRLKEVFSRIAEPGSLHLAFARVRENQGSAGIDGESISEFAGRLSDQVATLVSELLSGSYMPLPALPVQIAKPDGGSRQLRIPAVRDRVVQTAASTLLMSELDREMEEVSFAYRRGRSVDMAIGRVARYRRDGFRWAVDADIKSFFDNVPHVRMIEVLQEFVDDERFVDLVSLWLETYGLGGRGLAQGSPISPVLANLFLDGLDECIPNKDTRLVRYADDFVILSKDLSGAERAQRKAADYLASAGLQFHPEKTRIVSYDQPLKFLGKLFVRSMLIEEPDGDISSGSEKSMATDKEESALSRRTKKTLYLAGKGARIAWHNEALDARTDGHLTARVKLHLIERVEVYPDVEVETSALRALMLAGIPVDFVDDRGEPLGHLNGRAGRHGPLHLAQAGVISDPARRFSLAKELVSARIHNHRALLRRLNRRKNDQRVVRACEEINRTLRKLDQASTVSSLMAYEGLSAKSYWPALGGLLQKDWIFEHRRRRPSGSPFDAVLSYLATMLTNDVARAVNRAGLHPGFAVLHATKDEDCACATDLVEQFRGPIAESCAVTLVAQNAIEAGAILQDAKLGYRLADEAREAVIRGYERLVGGSIRDPVAGGYTRWRNLLDRQARRFAEALVGSGAYRAYRMDY